MLPRAFVWTKMGAESGEALTAIIKRKEFAGVDVSVGADDAILASILELQISC